MATSETARGENLSSLSYFHAAVRRWFLEAFAAPTPAQAQAWPGIASGCSTLLLAPTGSGKTLAAFLVAVDRIMFGQVPTRQRRGVRVLYVSPLKALGVDVERNLRPPIAGVRALAQREGIDHYVPEVGIRSGDTPSADRQRLVREPPDILITTPESLYLMLTSRARETLKTVDTVIVDEIHSLVGSKRGAHLFVSLERLERLRRLHDAMLGPMQRIGLSATQRPLDEVARLLAGGQSGADPLAATRPRPVEIVNAGYGKQFDLRIEVPVEDMVRLDTTQAIQTGPAAAGPSPPSIWPSIHPRLVELIRSHRSTMLFVNSRRLAERLASSINDLAGEELALAHHGSIAKETRRYIEDRLKRGQLPAIVATSSLELGIDMGAVDLVIQIEAPPSVAAGIQRIGRSGHHVGGRSSGVIFPKYRGDLLACSAATERMIQGEVEATFYPRNPLDVLAQQVVALVSQGAISVDEVFRTLKCAAPFFDLPRSAFEGVLDLLAGRYPSDEFAGLKPRLTWDRLAGELAPRRGAQRIAVLNAGTIPDRGLYGVYLMDDGSGGGTRVGELDEEMVFETRTGDVFLLGASSWRVAEITHDRVLVTPAPGESGRMPFWRGDGPGRPLEFGRAIGALTRQLLRLPRPEAESRLTGQHGLDARAAKNLLNYLHEQVEMTGEAPSDKSIVVECFLDEVGDWRVVILSPFGARIHAPWATAVAGKLRADTPGEVDLMWADDGIVFRLPESDEPPSTDALLPRADEIESLVVRQLGSTALFAARFRENAARALLLPRHQAGRRTPLWLQRRRAADLLSVASRYPNFPILLETYRECLRDVFDIAGLAGILRDVERREIRVRTVETRSPSPFASSLLFNYTASFIYEGDAPLAERRAQTLALDHAQLRELLGDAELRELLDAETMDQLALELQRLDRRYPVQHADALHELLQHLGDLSRDELAQRSDQQAVAGGDLDRWIGELLAGRRIMEVGIAGERRYAAAEDAARLRDVLGVVPPPGLPAAFLESVSHPLLDLVSRFARTHAPFTVEEVAARFGLGTALIRQALEELAGNDRVLEGEFRPGGRGREWCEVDVLRILKRRCLARLRKQVEPVEPKALGRFLPDWHGLNRPCSGLDGVLDVVEQLQGQPLPVSALDRNILPSRVRGYRPSDLDELCAAGEIVWRGFESLGSRDGRIALYLTDHLLALAPPAVPLAGELEQQIRQLLSDRGALFFEDIVKAMGGFPNELLSVIWDLVWSGEVTNDTFTPLRSRQRDARRQRLRRRDLRRGFRSRRALQRPGSEGRWSLLIRPGTPLPGNTERQAAIARQMLERYGVLTREMVASEGVVGGFAGLYPVLKAMEEAGKIRRGYFVAGLGGAQFATPGAEDRLREQGRGHRSTSGEVLVLAATDPANPYGAALPWPDHLHATARPQRAAGARVILLEGELIGYLGRTGQHLLTFLPDSEPEKTHAQQKLVETLVHLASAHEPLFVTKVDGNVPGQSNLGQALRAAGFSPSSRGYLHRGMQTDVPDHA